MADDDDLRVTVEITEVPHVVRVGEQGPPGTAGNFYLVDLADIDCSGTPDDGALLIYDISINKFRCLTTIEQGQTINGGYF